MNGHFDECLGAVYFHQGLGVAFLKAISGVCVVLIFLIYSDFHISDIIVQAMNALNGMDRYWKEVVGDNMTE